MPQSVTPDNLQRAIDEVLAAPPFVGAPREPLFARLQQLLRSLFDSLGGELLVADPATFWLIVGVAGVVLLVLSGHIAVSARQVWRAMRAGAAIDGYGTAYKAPSLEAAQAALAAGNLRQAVELAWGAVSETLISESRLRTYTPRMQARHLRAALGARSQDLEALVAAHEQACYSGEPLPRSMAESALQRAAALMAKR